MFRCKLHNNTWFWPLLFPFIAPSEVSAAHQSSCNELTVNARRSIAEEEKE